MPSGGKRSGSGRKKEIYMPIRICIDIEADDKSTILASGNKLQRYILNAISEKMKRDGLNPKYPTAIP